MSIPMRYETSYRWSGEGDRGETTVPGHEPLTVGGPVGEDHYSAEHLLVAAAEICLANTFFFLAEQSGLEVASWESTAEGELEYVRREGYRFKKIVLRPVIAVHAEDRERAERFLEKAHGACLIARSLSAPVEVQSRFL